MENPLVCTALLMGIAFVALLVAMAISFTYDIEPVDDSTGVNVALADSIGG